MAGKAYKLFLTGGGKTLELEGKIDLISDFEAVNSSKITDVPVESGSSISDHVIDEPVTLTISAIVTNIFYDASVAPISDLVDQSPSNGGEMTDSEFNAIASNLMSLYQNKSSLPEGRPESVYNELLNLKKNRELFTVHSMIGKYENMLMQDISHSENEGTGTALFVKISMKEMIFAESEFRIETVVIDSKKLAVYKGPPAKKEEKAFKSEEEKIAFINSCPKLDVNRSQPTAVFRDAEGPNAVGKTNQRTDFYKLDPDNYDLLGLGQR